LQEAAVEAPSCTEECPPAVSLAVTGAQGADDEVCEFIVRHVLERDAEFFDG
jgi:hypothetical protein